MPAMADRLMSPASPAYIRSLKYHVMCLLHVFNLMVQVCGGLLVFWQ
jgi:hypothetical protein